MFGDIKNKMQMALLKKHMASQGVSNEQVESLVTMFEKDPSLFENIAKEIQEKMKQGKGEMAASMEVMKKYQTQLQQLHSNSGSQTKTSTKPTALDPTIENKEEKKGGIGNFFGFNKK